MSLCSVSSVFTQANSRVPRGFLAKRWPKPFLHRESLLRCCKTLFGSPRHNISLRKRTLDLHTEMEGAACFILMGRFCIVCWVWWGRKWSPASCKDDAENEKKMCSLSLTLPLWLSGSLSVSLSFSDSLCQFLSLSASLYLSLYLSLLSLTFFLSICLFVSLCMFVCVSP